MATKAERHRYQSERSGNPRPKKTKPRRHSYQVDTARAGVSASDRRAGGTSTARRNLSLGRKAVFALEDSRAPKAPSRKSTRKSKNRQKAGGALKNKHLLATISPKSRHAR